MTTTNTTEQQAAPAQTWPVVLRMDPLLISEFAQCESGAHEDGEQAALYGISAFDVLERYTGRIEVRSLREAELILYAARTGTFELHSRAGASRVINWLRAIIEGRPAMTARREFVPRSAPAYDPINDVWAAMTNAPAFTNAEATRAARALYARFGKAVDGGPNMLNDLRAPTGPRRVWITTKPGPANLLKGLPRLVHDIAHTIFARRHPGWRPHHPQHARLEREMAAFALAEGWHTGSLRTAVKPKPSASDRAAARIERLRARLAAWESKQQRAERAAKKLRAQLRAAERRQLARDTAQPAGVAS